MNREIKFGGKRNDSDKEEEFTLEDIANLRDDYYSYEYFRQYTGLKDSKGVEIYEGDIVKWGHIENSLEAWHRVALVEINPDIQFKILKYISSIDFKDIPTDNYVFRYGKFAYKETENCLEVIGNIHSNPELLKQ